MYRKPPKQQQFFGVSTVHACWDFVQDLFNRLGSGNLYVEGGFPNLDADVRSNYIMNTTLLGVEKADAILLIGSNPRTEAPVFNARQVLLIRLHIST